MNRTQAMGSSGWEAYTIGFTLVGCIVAGAGLGWLLDNHFKTSFWLPILFLGGVVAGFREMLQILKRISQNEAIQRKAKAEREAANSYTPPPPDAQATGKAPTRERLFAVPPPPLEGEVEGIATQPTDAPETGAPETTEEIIERLLRDSEAEDDKPGQTHK